MFAGYAVAPGTVLVPSVGSWFCGRYAAPKSTAFRSTEPFAPPWNTRSRLKPWLPIYETSSAAFPGSAICTPPCHCHDDGMPALYWNVISAGTPTLLSPVPSVASEPLRRSCDVEIGGFPGIENTVLPSGRSKNRPPPPRTTNVASPVRSYATPKRGAATSAGHVYEVLAIPSPALWTPLVRLPVPGTTVPMSAALFAAPG